MDNREAQRKKLPTEASTYKKANFDFLVIGDCLLLPSGNCIRSVRCSDKKLLRLCLVHKKVAVITIRINKSVVRYTTKESELQANIQIGVNSRK